MDQRTLEPKVDAFIENAQQWQNEYKKIREIFLEFPWTEEFKWGVPCYTIQNKNVALIHGFKNYCAILFVKGALLSDPDGILVQQTENVQAARQIRFTGIEDILRLESQIKDYIKEAIENEKSGKEVEFQKAAETSYPLEFQNKIDEMPELKAAFEALTPGRQRAYLIHFSSPKQEKTREARIEKNIERILGGKGLDDR